MDRETVEAMSRVAGILAKVKGTVARSEPALYMEIRDLLCDCQEIMAIHCDCAPIRLIAGQIDEIMDNLRSSVLADS